MKSRYWWGGGGAAAFMAVLVWLGAVLTSADQPGHAVPEQECSCVEVQMENDRLMRELSGLKGEIEALRSRPHTQLFHSSKVLAEKGLDDPVRALVADLKQREDLIPMAGVLEGTMRFRNEASWVITDKWVLAHFDDGHKGGTLLLAYSVDHNGNIHWTVMDFAPH